MRAKQKMQDDGTMLWSEAAWLGLQCDVWTMQGMRRRWTRVEGLVKQRRKTKSAEREREREQAKGSMATEGTAEPKKEIETTRDADRRA